MTVTTVKTLLQAKHATITGLTSTSCPVNWPASQIASFPLCLVRKDTGISRKVSGKAFSRDTWKVYLFLSRQHQDTYVAAINSTDAWIELFRDTYTNPANAWLSTSPTIISIANLPKELAAVGDDGPRDTGLTEIEYLKEIYYGVVFDLVVTEQEI